MTLFTARKRSLGQDNAFTPMCYSGTSCLPAWSHVLSRGFLCPGVRWSLSGHLCPRGSLPGGLCDRDLHLAPHISEKITKKYPK